MSYKAIITTPEQKLLAIEVLRKLKMKFPKVAEMAKNNLEVNDLIDEEILRIVDIDYCQ